MPGRAESKGWRRLLGAALAVPVGVVLLVLCVSFFRAARGVFGEGQAGQRITVVLVTILGAALALALLSLAAVSFVGRRKARVTLPDPEPPAAS